MDTNPEHEIKVTIETSLSHTLMYLIQNHLHAHLTLILLACRLCLVDQRKVWSMVANFSKVSVTSKSPIKVIDLPLKQESPMNCLKSMLEAINM